MTSDRFESISGLLGNKPKPRQATVHPIGGDTDGTGTESPRASSSTTDQGTERRAPGPSHLFAGTRRVGFRLNPDLHARLVARAKANDMTHGDVVLDAIEATHSEGRLGQLIEAAKEDLRRPVGSLFARANRRGSAKPSVPIEIQLQAQAIDQLDQLVDEHGADNRTQLMVAALKGHLEVDRRAV